MCLSQDSCPNRWDAKLREESQVESAQQTVWLHDKAKSWSKVKGIGRRQRAGK